ncbi:MAG: hypothetical protein JWM12_2415 [Ilumatobacteraceae bacterium]|nr:hypothetical protein [Ilumatobacteraceae bacterium]
MRALMSLLGLGPRRSWVEVGDDVVPVRMGWAFAADIPRPAISGVALRERNRISRGVHGWNGRYLVNGSGEGLVTITVEPPQRAAMLGFPITLRELTVSVDDPAGLVAALG